MLPVVSSGDGSHTLSLHILHLVAELPADNTFENMALDFLINVNKWTSLELLGK